MLSVCINKVKRVKKYFLCSNDGWDRTVLRRSFVNFYRQLVLPNVDTVASTPRKIRSKEQTRHRNPPLLPADEQARPRSGDKTALTANLSNQRTALAQYFANDQHVITNRDLIQKRYEDKLTWFENNFVSIKIIATTAKYFIFYIFRIPLTRVATLPHQRSRKKSTFSSASVKVSTETTSTILTVIARRPASKSRTRQSLLNPAC